MSPIDDGDLPTKLAWLQQRVKDLVASVEELRENRDMLIRLQTQCDNIKEDVSEVKATARDLAKSVEEGRRDEEKRQKEERQQARTDRRWLLSTIIATGVLVVAAVSLVVSNV